MKNFPAAFVSLLPLAAAAAEPTPVLEEMVVTASGIDEAVSGVAQAVRVFSGEEINESAPRQLTDFFAARGLAQIQDAGPGHTTLFLRGFSTVGLGQAWSDGSEISVLINGRPAGTANLAKLSTQDLQRIEILNGPNSVLYGSSALGGVVNLITETGATFEGTELTTLFSSFDRYSQSLETGGKQGELDYYLSLAGTSAQDYKTGRGSSGRQPNTAYDQRSANLTVGYHLKGNDRLQFMFRHDGIYDVGHPGPTYSFTDHDDRYGTSAELFYTGATPDGRYRWTDRFYWLRDTDELYRSQNPLIGLIPAILAPGLIGTPGITRDDSVRRLTEWGNRAAFYADLTPQNTLTTGLDLRLSETENHRERVAAPGYRGGFIGIPVIMPPLAINSRTTSTAVYLQDSQTLFNDRLKLTLGSRYDRTREQALRTENSPVRPDSETRDLFVHQAGATFQANDWLTFRANAGSGFLAANATQLFGTIRTANGYSYIPNPTLKGEKSIGWDTGIRAARRGFTADLSFYENTTRDPITAYLYPATATLQYRNADKRLVRGIQGELSQDLADYLPTGGISVTPYLGGNWFLTKEAADLSGRTAGIYYLADYSLNAGIRAGQPGKWSADLYVTASGPSEINAGFLQNANVPLREIQKTETVPAYAVLNFAANWQATKNLTVFGGVNNLLDKNYSSYYIARNNRSTADVAPYLLPGVASGEGSSAPGREIFGGVTFRF
jgi:vitamin B12 transporter